jgi:ATP-dependent Clp protease ATP-binding subunit ClpC
MFERFEEPTRDALLSAFLTVREHGGTHIQPEHVVLGILRSAPIVIRRFTTVEAIEALTTRLESAIPTEPKYPQKHEVPFSEATIKVIERAVIEADDLQSRAVRSEHLLLGVLVKTSGEAADALHSAGVHLDPIRQFLQLQPEG